MKEYCFTVCAPLDVFDALHARYGNLLSEYRRQKTVQLRDTLDKKRGLLAEYCLIEAMKQIDPSIELPLQMETEHYGKPYLLHSDVQISLTHAGKFAAAAVCSASVGLDIEQTRPISDALAKRVCTAHEYQDVWLKNPKDETFRNLFSAKESFVKRTGEGLTALSKVDTLMEPTIRQRFMEPYVLSITTDCCSEWEVYVCDSNGSLICL